MLRCRFRNSGRSSAHGSRLADYKKRADHYCRVVVVYSRISYENNLFVLRPIIVGPEAGAISLAEARSPNMVPNSTVYTLDRLRTFVRMVSDRLGDSSELVRRA